MLAEFLSHLATLLEKNDTVLIHSDIRHLFKLFIKNGVRISIKDLLEIICNTVHNGTVLFPTFNFNFCQNKFYSINNTPSLLGVLSEYARIDTRFKRTAHPMISFAVCGRRREEFCSLTNISGYGSGSPFDLLHRLNAKIAIINLPENRSMTFYHHIEEILQVSYRSLRTFTGEYQDCNDNIEQRRYDLYARDNAKTITNVTAMGEILWNKGAYLGRRPYEGFGIRVAQARDIFLHTKEVIEHKKGDGILFEYLRT